MVTNIGCTYCLNLTEEEKKKIDENARKSRINLMLRITILVSALSGATLVGAAPLPGADGFPPPAPRARARNPNQCRGYSNSILSRAATGATQKVEDQPGSRESNTYYDASLNCKFENKQLQKKFKHAGDFGVSGNYNPANAKLFRKKLIAHMNSTHACLGTYRGKPVYHYYDPKTRLNVMVDRNNNTFISGWKLNRQQAENMRTNGNIGHK